MRAVRARARLCGIHADDRSHALASRQSTALGSQGQDISSFRHHVPSSIHREQRITNIDMELIEASFRKGFNGRTTVTRPDSTPRYEFVKLQRWTVIAGMSMLTRAKTLISFRISVQHPVYAVTLTLFHTTGTHRETDSLWRKPTR